jgi:hypothetical protein
MSENSTSVLILGSAFYFKQFFTGGKWGRWRIRKERVNMVLDDNWT